MIAGRRFLLCCSSFLGLALLLISGTARAQDSPHRLWKSNLTPEQLKAALAGLAAGEGTQTDAFKDQILDLMRKEHPNFSKEDIENALKILKDHPELLDQAKKMAKEKQIQPGRPGQLTQEDLAKLFQTKPGADFQVPDPKDFPPPGKLEPPQPGKLEPPQPGKIEPPPQPGKVEPPQPPGNNGNPPNPMNPGDQPKTKFDPNDFPESENGDQRSKFQSLWEQNVGSLEDTPEMKRALLDLLSGSDGFDFDLKDGNGNNFWDFLKDGEGGSGSDFGDLFKGSGSGDWGMGDWHFPSFGNWFGGGSSSSSSSSWFGSGSSSPRPSSSGGGFGGGWGIGGLGGAWLPFLILLLAILAVVIWFQVKNMKSRVPVAALAGDGLGAWPLDPRDINTRQDVVLAFEYLSVLICGPSAKNWTHSTIAEALTDLATTHGETAIMLARLYELARYAPLDEPLTHDELIEARKLVCTLAGVSY
jgi:hypothetical protein